MQARKYFKDNNESGVTLVELLAAITILAIIVTAFLSFFIQGARTNTRASNVNEATFIAQEEMELMVHYSQTLTLDDVRSQEGFNGGPVPLSKSFVNTDGYSVKTEISLVNNEEVPENIHSVKITVEKDGTVQSILENRLAFE
ncbi:MAG: prepilin-type N-terminal cleavage/methylation domain-containing protein [Alkalibacterium sp.]|nr:prepilin-type N-terminal cleavage/methylation domain-containing protein [Alkalibacterium sp.]